MALPDCVRVVLCGLSSAVRNALVALVKGYSAELGLYVSALEARLVYLDILTAPIAVTANLAEAALSQAKAGANLIPLSLIGGCIEVGGLNEAIQANLDVVLADVNNVATDLERLLSFKDEVQAAINDAKAVINIYTEVVSILDACSLAGVA